MINWPSERFIETEGSAITTILKYWENQIVSWTLICFNQRWCIFCNILWETSNLLSSPSLKSASRTLSGGIYWFLLIWSWPIGPKTALHCSKTRVVIWCNQCDRWSCKILVNCVNFQKHHELLSNLPKAKVTVLVHITFDAWNLCT